jgi:hypothetical protein
VTKIGASQDDLRPGSADSFTQYEGSLGLTG